jgi:DNA-binding GntR family transcriptional regulator
MVGRREGWARPWRLIDRYLHLHVGMFGDMAPLHAEHRAILDAVRAGNADLAAELTREHLANSHRVILEHKLLTATSLR